MDNFTPLEFLIMCDECTYKFRVIQTSRSSSASIIGRKLFEHMMTTGHIVRVSLIQ